MNNNPFNHFLGEYIKAPYRDGSQIKIARGRLEEINDGFVKVVGKLGTIIINSKNIERMSKLRENEMQKGEVC